MGVRFSANVSLLFSEQPLLKRFEAAATAGFSAVEVWWPFDGPEPRDSDAREFTTSVQEAGVHLVAMNLDAGDMAAGDRGLVSLPGARKRFRQNVPVAVGLAAELGCGAVNALYGNRQDGVAPERQDALALENLAYAAKVAAPHGITVLVEPLNTIENRRYPLASTADALSLLDRLRSGGVFNVGLLYDAYHMQRMEGNLIDTIRRNASDIAHVQIADSPGRSEPGTGEIAYHRVLDALVDSGYDGHVGLEYKSTRATVESLGWLDPSGRDAVFDRNDLRPSEFFRP